MELIYKVVFVSFFIYLSKRIPHAFVAELYEVFFAIQTLNSWSRVRTWFHMKHARCQLFLRNYHHLINVPLFMRTADIPWKSQCLSNLSRKQLWCGSLCWTRKGDNSTRSVNDIHINETQWYAPKAYSTPGTIVQAPGDVASPFVSLTPAYNYLLLFIVTNLIGYPEICYYLFCTVIFLMFCCISSLISLSKVHIIHNNIIIII